LEVCP
jgi:phosphodiesterase/alkaline phosphatase D-like protein